MRTSVCLPLAVVGLLGVAAAPPGRAETTVTPSIRVAGTWVDNIDLAPPGAPATSETVLEAVPEIDLKYGAPRARASLHYLLDAFDYLGDSSRNQAYQRASATLGSDLIERWLYLDGSGTYNQQTIAPTRKVSTDLVFQTQNVADVGTWNVSPALRHQFSDAAFEARYTVGWVRYGSHDPLQTVSLENSRNYDRMVKLESPADALSHVTWRLYYDSQEADYTSAPVFRYDSGYGELGWRFSPRFRVFARGGAETDLLKNISTGGLESPYWAVGFEVRREHNVIEVSGGHRFFGKSLSAKWERTAKLLKLSVDYREEPTTSAQDLALRPIPANPEQGVVPLQDLGRLASEAYVLRDLTATVTLVGRRTELSFFGTFTRREYLSSGLEDREKGGGVTATRQLSSQTSLFGSASAQTISVREGGIWNDRRFRLGAERKLGRKAKVSLQASRASQSSPQFRYDVNFVTLAFDKQF